MGTHMHSSIWSSLSLLKSTLCPVHATPHTELERTDVVLGGRNQAHNEQQPKAQDPAYFNAYFPEGSYLHIIYF